MTATLAGLRRADSQPRESIRTRIAVLAASLLVLLLIYTLFALYLSRESRNALQPITQVEVPLQGSVTSIIAAQFEQHAIIERMLRIGTASDAGAEHIASEIRQTSRRFAELHAATDNQFDRIESLLRDERLPGAFRRSTIEEMASVRNHYDDFVGDCDTLLELANGGDAILASGLVEAMELNSERVGRELQALFTSISDRIESTVQTVNERADALGRTLAATGMVSFLIGLAFAVRLVGSIHRRSRSLVTAITTVENNLRDRGSPEGRIADTGADEFGRIARVFDDLLDRLDLTLEQRDEADRKLRRALEQANSASQAKGAFLANMSHELRTPLNAVVGYSELIMEEDPATPVAQSRADLERIRASGLHLLRIINEILDLSKIEAGAVSVYVQREPLQELTDAVMSIVRHSIERNGNTHRLVLPPQAVLLETDCQKLRQVLINLLSNAAKFTRDGRVDLRISSFRGRRGEARLRFIVEDSGIGIPSQDLDRIFDAFSQADNSPTRQFQGTGLGLSISRHYVEMLGGKIQATSEPNVGSTFSFDIPVVYVPSSAAQTPEYVI